MKLYAPSSISPERPKISDPTIIEMVSRDPVFIMPLLETNPNQGVAEIARAVEQALHNVFSFFKIAEIDRTILMCYLFHEGLIVTDRLYKAIGEPMFQRFMPHYQEALRLWIEANDERLQPKYEVGREIDVLDYGNQLRSGVIEGIDMASRCYKVDYVDAEAKKKPSLVENVRCVGTSVPFEIVEER